MSKPCDDLRGVCDDYPACVCGRAARNPPSTLPDKASAKSEGAAPQGDADGAKRAVSAILGKALRGSDGAYRTVDGYTRWGRVEDDIHAAIDAAIAKGRP